VELTLGVVVVTDGLSLGGVVVEDVGVVVGDVVVGGVDSVPVVVVSPVV